MSRTPLLVALAVLLSLGLAGCSVADDAYAAKAKAAAAARRTALQSLPDGYRDGGSGFGYRLTDRRCTTEDGSRCRVLALFAYTACSSGYVEADLLDSRKRVVGVVNGSLGAVPDDTGTTMRLEWTAKTVRSVRVTTVRCG